MKTVAWRNRSLVLGSNTDVLLELEDFMESRTPRFLDVIGLAEIKSSFSTSSQPSNEKISILEDSAVGRLLRLTRAENVALVNVDSLIDSLQTISEENGRSMLFILDDQDSLKHHSKGRTTSAKSSSREFLLEEQIITQGVDLVMSTTNLSKASSVFKRCTENYHKPLVWIQLPRAKTNALSAKSSLATRIRISAYQAVDALQCAWKIVSKTPTLNQESR